MNSKGIIEKLGWFYVLSVAPFNFVLYLAISRHGDVKLGADHSDLI
jgi:choline/glycine/proline betaine transport protein